MKNFRSFFNTFFTTKIKKIVSISLQSILFVLLLLTVATFVSSRTPLFGQFRSMVVLTGSMEPVLPVGSIVYITKQIAYDNKDVITFQNNAGQNVTHRIVDIAFTDEGTVYTTKGDANERADTALVPNANVTGKVFFTLPFIGKVINFLNRPEGFISLVIVPTFFLIVIELWNIKKELEKHIEKKLMDRLQIN